MLQIHGNFMLLLPDVARSCAAEDNVSAAPGEGERGPFVSPHITQHEHAALMHGQGAGAGGPVRAGCRQAAGLQESRSRSGLGWAVNDPKRETCRSP